jgi:hypothetical protein
MRSFINNNDTGILIITDKDVVDIDKRGIPITVNDSYHFLEKICIFAS